MKAYYCTLDYCNDHRTYENLTPNEIVEIPVTLTCLSVVNPDSKTDRMQSRPLLIELVDIYIDICR
jgi:hypothetical protein